MLGHWMKVVIHRIANLGLQTGKTLTTGRAMASGADFVALALQLPRVGIVTIAAGYTPGVHFALQEGAVNKYLVENLTVGIVQPVAQQGLEKMIQIRPAGGKAFGDLATPTVTAGTHL